MERRADYLWSFERLKTKAKVFGPFNPINTHTMHFLLTTVLSTLLLFPLAAQLESDTVAFTLIPPDTTFKVERPEFVGLVAGEEGRSGQDLLISFEHTGGALKWKDKALGSLNSVQEPASLGALVRVHLGEDGIPRGTSMQWVSSISLSRKPADFYSQTPEFPDASTFRVALYEDMLPRMEATNLKRSATASSPLYRPQPSTPAPAPQKTATEKKEPLPRYYVAGPSVNLKGQIGKVGTSSMDLQPGTAASGKPTYKLNYSVVNNPEPIAIEGATYKLTAGESKAADPKDGISVYFGGLKYKKDKTKKGSFRRDFLLLAYNKDGELINSERYESELPLKIIQSHIIEGEPITDKVREGLRLVTILQEVPKHDEKADAKKHRVLITDLKTGELISKASVELPGSSFVEISKHSIDDGLGLSLLNFHNKTRGLSELLVRADGSVAVNAFPADSPEVKGLGISADKQFHSLQLKRQYALPRKDGTTLGLYRLVGREAPEEVSAKNLTVSREPGTFAVNTPEQTPGPEANEALVFFSRTKDGRVKELRGIGGIKGYHQLHPLKQDGDLLHLLAVTGSDNKSVPRLLTINLTTLSTSRIQQLTPGQYMTGPTAFYYAADLGKVYILGSAGDHGALHVDTWTVD